MSFSVLVSSRYMPSSGIAESHGGFMETESPYLSSIVAVPIYIPTSSVGGFPFLHILASTCCLWILVLLTFNLTETFIWRSQHTLITVMLNVNREERVQSYSQTLICSSHTLWSSLLNLQIPRVSKPVFSSWSLSSNLCPWLWTELQGNQVTDLLLHSVNSS